MTDWILPGLIIPGLVLGILALGREGRRHALALAVIMGGGMWLATTFASETTLDRDLALLLDGPSRRDLAAVLFAESMVIMPWLAQASDRLATGWRRWVLATPPPSTALAVVLTANLLVQSVDGTDYGAVALAAGGASAALFAAAALMFRHALRAVQPLVALAIYSVLALVAFGLGWPQSPPPVDPLMVSWRPLALASMTAGLFMTAGVVWHRLISRS